VAALDFCCLAAGVDDAGCAAEAGRFFESACLGGGACRDGCQYFQSWDMKAVKKSDLRNWAPLPLPHRLPRHRHPAIKII
jgi:hypothetical protein